MSKKKDDWFASAQEDIIKDQMQDEEEAKAAPWNPDDGDLLKGEFVKVVPYWKEYDGRQVLNYKAYIKDLDQKEKPLRLVFVTRSVLKQEFLDAMPAPGALVVIQYFGKVEIQNSDRTYFSYKVRAAEADADYWKKVGTEAIASKPEVQPVQSFGPEASPF